MIGKTKETGTRISFLPDDTIFDKTRFKEDDVKSRLHETAYLNPNLTIVFEDRRQEVPEHIEYHEPEGIVGFIKDMNKSKEAIHDVIYFQGYRSPATGRLSVPEQGYRVHICLHKYDLPS